LAKNQVNPLISSPNDHLKKSITYCLLCNIKTGINYATHSDKFTLDNLGKKMDEGMLFVLIILFAFVLPIVMVGTWTSHKKEMAKANANLNNSEKEKMQNELASVKSRLEVLEAIVTDKKYQLHQEINELKAVD
jgi:hypothetical protein